MGVNADAAGVVQNVADVGAVEWAHEAVEHSPWASVGGFELYSGVSSGSKDIVDVHSAHSNLLSLD